MKPKNSEETSGDPTSGPTATPSESGEDFLRAVAGIPAREPPEPDPTRIGQFRILGRLGRGGMGIVYRAEDENLRRQVALKVLPPAVSGNVHRRRRFLQEARAAAAVHHPNVATLFGVDEADGHLFLAMELVEGETLRSRAGRSPLPLSEALSIAQSLARGMAAAHAKGIVHRDLKPDNVMISAGGEVKILDFGLAKPTGPSPTPAEQTTESHLTQEGAVFGTPAYMSPEQARGDPVDARTDVFAFGVLLYELVTGRRPFTGATPLAVALAVSRDTPSPVSALAPEVPLRVERVIERCLKKEAAERYADGEELLRAFDSTTPVEAERPLGLRVRPRRRHLGIAVVGLLVLLGLLAGGAALRQMGPRHPSQSKVSARPPVRVITEYPPPKTRSPEAAIAYASALQHLRDGDLDTTATEFRRATKLDPTFAAAHLRLVLQNVGNREPIESYAAAFQYRDSLDERDQLLLRVAESLRHDQYDGPEMTARMREVLKSFPDDIEALYYLGRYQTEPDRAAERSAPERAVSIDPQFAGALFDLARYHEDAGEDDAALDGYGRCLKVSPAATSCLRRQAAIHARRGQCTDFESDARRDAMVAPKSPQAFRLLASALASRRAPPESVRAALDKGRVLEEVSDPSAVERDRVREEVAVASLSGDLASSLSGIQQLERLADADTLLSTHYILTMAEFTFLEEEGDLAGAVKVAESFEHRVAAWTEDSYDWVSLRLLYEQHRSGRVDDLGFSKARQSIEEAVVRHWTGASSPRSEQLAWFTMRASFVESANEISGALRSSSPEMDFDSTYQFLLGKIDLLEGHVDQALPLLRHAVAACDVLPDYFADHPDAVVLHLRRYLWLGRALEAAKDNPAACTAYGAILDRWGNPTPRSTTVEKARERVKALGCPR